MKYAVTGAHGDAGEFFFAYKIASVLKWPCRLFDIDIGIDAQVEIINTDRTSAGKFVAFQIKATSAEEQDCRYVLNSQLVYWRDHGLPVFVVLVDLSKELMYLHRVSSDNEYPVTKKGKVRIDFDLTADLFGAESASKIAGAAEETALAHVNNLLAEVMDGVVEIETAISETENNPDPRGLIEVMNDRTRHIEKLAQAKAVASTLRVGAAECNGAAERLSVALDELREHMQDYKMHDDWDGLRDGDGEIGKFIRESR